MPVKTPSYSVVSLFSGCGGMDLGFAGGFQFLDQFYSKRKFNVIWANDIDEKACLTYSKNFSDSNIFSADIRDILENRYIDISLPDKTDIVLGGFPCQDFSHAGKRRGFDNENRGTLYKSMVEVVKRLKPKIFIAENVRGLLTIDNGKAIKKILNDFSAIGYKVTYNLYHVAEFGVPQSRERVLIIGTDNSLPEFKRIASLGLKEYITLKDAIGDLENIKEGNFQNHFWSKAKMFKGTQGNSFVSANKIGPTMRAEHHGNIEWHWNKKRRLSAREAARIQSFPDSFLFYPSTSSAYKQIGNAVPPVFAWHLAKAIEEFLDLHTKNQKNNRNYPLAYII